MIIFSNGQPLYCQNTFYKQFISEYKFIINIYQISKNTQTLGYNPFHHTSPMGKRCQTSPIATIINRKFCTVLISDIFCSQITQNVAGAG